jgi:hypothetical protein
MRVPSLLLAMSFCVAGYGCATAPDQPTSSPVSASAASPKTGAQPQREARYRTGSRIPLSDDGLGSENVKGAGREAYEDDRRNMVTPQKW